MGTWCQLACTWARRAQQHAAVACNAVACACQRQMDAVAWLACNCLQGNAMLAVAYHCLQWYVPAMLAADRCLQLKHAVLCMQACNSMKATFRWVPCACSGCLAARASLALLRKAWLAGPPLACCASQCSTLHCTVQYSTVQWAGLLLGGLDYGQKE